MTDNKIKGNEPGTAIAQAFLNLGLEAEAIQFLTKMQRVEAAKLHFIHLNQYQELCRMGHFDLAERYWDSRVGADSVCFKCPECESEYWIGRHEVIEKCDVCEHVFEQADEDRGEDQES